MSQPTCTFSGIHNSTPATYIIHDPDGADIPVCTACAVVFEYGKISPRASVSIIQPDNRPDEPDKRG